MDSLRNVFRPLVADKRVFADNLNLFHTRIIKLPILQLLLIPSKYLLQCTHRNE